MTHDAVVVVPGIMGSELMDLATGKPVWGFRDPHWYVRAWTSGEPLSALALDDDERNGRYGRIRPVGLLAFPAFAPVLRGFEPYSRLVKALRRAVPDRAAVAEFAYDWRLPVSHNAALLADRAMRHLAAWRSHLAEARNRPLRGDGDEPRLLIIAHSMGGLLARDATRIPGFAELVRATVTLGAPFFGAPKAAIMLAGGIGAPVRLPKARLRKLAVTLPGLYDLLPSYRCVDVGTHAEMLSADRVGSLGGDRELAQRSADWHRSLAGVQPVGHLQVVGAHQPTIQALTVDAGVVAGHRYTCSPAGGNAVERADLAGDGTVPRTSAQLPGTIAMPLAQSHGSLARTSEAILIAVDTLVQRPSGPWQGGGEFGVDVPELLRAGEPLVIKITGADHPRDASCQITDVRTMRPVDVPAFGLRDGQMVAVSSPLLAGLYRIDVTGGGMSSVSQMSMVV